MSDLQLLKERATREYHSVTTCGAASLPAIRDYLNALEQALQEALQLASKEESV